MKRKLFYVSIPLLLALLAGLAFMMTAEEYPKGCTAPNGHSGQDQPHTQTNHGDLQCHASKGDDGNCSFSAGGDTAEMNCRHTTFTGSAITTCTVTLECGNETPQSCLAVGSGNGNMSAIIGKDNGDNEVYGHCLTQQGTEQLLTCN